MTQPQIDVSVNAPEAGVIKEFLVSEEDTVTVGQDLVKLEPGQGSGQKTEAKEEPKEPASEKQSTGSNVAPRKEEKKPAPKQEESAPSKPTTTKQESRPQREPETPAPKSPSSSPSFGSRDERRAC